MIHENKDVSRDEWLLMAEDYRNVSIQMTGVGVVVVRLVAPGQDAPDNEDETGAQIQNGGSSFAAGGLPDGTRVYARSKRDGVETVNVLAY